MRLADLKLNPDNPRNIKPEKLEKLAQSIKDFPKMMVKRPIVYDENKIIIGGNMRYKAIEKLGMTEIPDEWTSDASDFTPEERKRFIMQDNAEMGEHDWDMVANQYELEDLDAWGIDVPYADVAEEVEEDEAPEVSSEPAISELGKIYQLGRHRVMCGDSTDAGNVALLMNGEKADMVFTDPPYGINVVGDKGNIGGDTKLAPTTKFRKVIGDDKEFDPTFLLGLAPNHFIWGGNYFAHLLPKGGRWFVWDKNRPEGLSLSDCELAWSDIEGVKVQKFKCTWDGYHKEGESGTRVHPNQKPIKLLADVLNELDIETILDLFLGSGSTLIACEQTDRTCYGMELDPKYVDVIRKRYWKFVNDGDEKGWEDATARVN